MESGEHELDMTGEESLDPPAAKDQQEEDGKSKPAPNMFFGVSRARSFLGVGARSRAVFLFLIFTLPRD